MSNFTDAIVNFNVAVINVLESKGILTKEEINKEIEKLKLKSKKGEGEA